MPEDEQPSPAGAVSLYLRPKNDLTTQKTAGKIRCFLGGEWKPRSEFSGRQLEKFARSRADPARSDISCRVHSTQVRRELKCEGPCAKWLPIENFSKATRSHSKTWCMDCTEWQLSVEPGYAPYVPPCTLEEEEEEDEEADEEREIMPADEIPGERIEDWIQDNPSDVGGYARIDTRTSHGSTVGSISDTSGQSLLDTRNREIGGLPEALTATNLSLVGSVGPGIPSYASIASTSTVKAPATTVSQASRPAARGQMVGRGPMRASETGSVSQSNQSASNTLYSAESATTQSQSVAGNSTVWNENGFQALTIGTPRPPQRVETRNGWARPVQRKTDLSAPRYVATNGGLDLRPLNIQRTVYTDADDEGSEDEC